MNASHVVSQGLAAELKASGWPQRESFFSWHEVNYRGEKEWTLGETNMQFAGMIFQSIVAPLASELMERMPVSVSIENDERTNKLMVMKLESTWLCQYEFLDSDGDGWGVYADASLPDAIAKLALHLIKENKLNLE